MAVGYLYEILNIVNNKRYIGQTMRSPAARWPEHITKLNKGVHGNAKLQAAWNKYGSKNFIFSVIVKCESAEELNVLEEAYVKRNVNGYNLVGGGKNRKWSVESRRKLSKSKSGIPNGQLGMKKKSMTAENKIKMSLINKPSGYPDIVDPMGNLYTISNVREFSKQHNLWYSGLASLFGSKGACFHYRGWRIATPETIGVKFDASTYNKRAQISKGRRPTGFPNLKAPGGEIVTIDGTLTDFCKRNQLSASNISQLINHKKTSYKGWTLEI